VNQLIAPPVVKKVTAQTPEFEYSNSMSESTHSIFKGEFMGGKFSIDIEQHLKDQDRFMIYYNHQRYLCRSHGLTPFEVLEGQIPCKSWYKVKIQEAKEQRIIENRKFNACGNFC
jgi:hypothetical protein